MTCGQCALWNLKGAPLRVYSFGLCKADKDAKTQKASNFAASHPCHMGKFEQAGAVTMARREQEKARAK
jgi:hypothetical protein